MPTIICKRKKIVIIPARMASGRFPGKPMATVGGKPLVHWTYDRAEQTVADYVVVATPDREIARYCQENGLVWRPTREDHPTGTHRCAEVLDHIEIGVVMNWQVDEPLIPVEDANRLMESDHSIGTLVASRGGQPEDNSVVKVAVSPDSSVCHWFSRAPMVGASYHCGVYLFQPEILRVLGRTKPSVFSLAESLEQLAWIEHGHTIYGVRMERLPLGINLPEDFVKFKEMVENQNGD